MNVLLLSSRFPWPAFTGDRLRASIWLSALAPGTSVALVAPAGEVPAGAPPLRFYPAARSLTRAAAGAWQMFRGGPASAMLAAPYDWAGAIESARRDFGPFDTTIVLLSRFDPSVRELLPDGFHVLDAIDSLRRNVEERSREASPLTRWFWRAEARRLGRVEADAARAYDRLVVVSAEDREELGAVAVSNGVAIAPLLDTPRLYDFGFWGRLGYFANADAVDWLLDEIWPAVRAARPQATLLLAGAGASPRLRALHGRDGITVQSPVDDMAALARQVSVALMPVRYGTGQANKTLEAAEAGCAIVGTPAALRGLDALAAHASLAADAEGLARAAVALTSDSARRAAMGKALRAAVETHYSRAETLARLAALVQRAEVAA